MKHITECSIFREVVMSLIDLNSHVDIRYLDYRLFILPPRL